jgi:uncharacterized protein YjbI with pentapeptide repeats
MRAYGTRERGFAFHHASGAAAFTVRARTETEALRAHLLDGGSLRGLDLSGRILRGLDLSGADLSGALLRNADLRGCPVSFARFDGADLSGADLAGVVGTGVSFRGANLGRHGGKPAVLDGADLPAACLADARLDGASLCRTVLERADLSGVDARGAAFRDAVLGDAEHGRAAYRDCDFTRADLRPLGAPPRRGVTRTDRTAGTLAVANVLEGALIGAGTPAFVRDRRLSALSKAISVGLAGAAVAGTLALGGAAADLAGQAAGHVVDTAALADRLDALVHYRHVADLLSGTAPARWLSAHSTIAVAAVVSGAVLLRDKLGDKAKDYLSGHVRKALDAARPLVADVARRIGNLSGVVAAVTASPGAAATIMRGLAETGGGPGAPVRDVSVGGTQVIVCTAGNLNRAMERLSTGLGRNERPSQDVLVVRDRPADDGAPVALRLHAAGGMTAVWAGAGGIREVSWPAADFLSNPAGPWVRELPADGPDAARAAFENAILRDRLPGLDVGYRAGRGRVDFGEDGLVRVVGSGAGGGPRTYVGRLDDGPEPETVFRGP